MVRLKPLQPQSKHALQNAGIILADSRLHQAVTSPSRLLFENIDAYMAAARQCAKYPVQPSNWES